MTMDAQVDVLNVDDNDPQRYIKTRDLQRAGFVVIEAETGIQALRLVEQHRPPVLLLDVKLPDISGLEVCRRVKQAWPGVMVLMTSATFTSSSARTLGLDAGADSYLVQPAEPLELAAAVNALLRLRSSESELRRLNDTLEQRVRDRVTDLQEANQRLKAEIAQRQLAEAALVQSQKMEAVGQLTGGLAHDFNNLLTAVLGNLEFIRTRADDPRIRRWADNAFRAAQRGSRLTSQLLAFSRAQKLITAPVDVNALILGMRELLNQTLGANITIAIELDPALPAAMADQSQLELAILNLAINARDAMPDGGVLTITTAARPGNAQPVMVSVSDTGTGMPPEVAARAFDPFFTTKPPGKGTGLGLSQVYGIARQTGGDVSIESEVDKGTTVTLRLPRAADRVVSEHDRESETVRARPGEKLLVVDDDSDVREIVSSFLAELGYQVRDVPQGDAALAIIAELDPDLLVVDFAMPGMNGAEMAQAARQWKSCLPILFLSGFADSTVLEAAVGSAPLLKKPFRPVDLAAAVRAALDARDAGGGSGIPRSVAPASDADIG
jgi:signal transduction histidine kinase